MVFVVEGQLYDSADMLACETGNPGIPLVYVTADRQCVFVLTCGRDGVNVHRADACEVRYLAEQFRLKTLEGLSPQPPGSA